MAHMIFIAYTDNLGASRAWATGPTEKAEEVMKEAKRQFRDYAETKLQLGTFSEMTPFEVIREDWHEEPRS